MPSQLHEVLVTMFTDRPSLAADLISEALGVSTLPFDHAVLTSADLGDVVPTEYRADAVVTLVRDDETAWAVVVEIQLSWDPRKRRTWPAYVANLHARIGCPVFLLVLCPSPRVAAACAETIVVSQPGLTLVPLVLGPDRVPVVADAEAAQRNPELAVLSAMAHGGRPSSEPILEALLAGLTSVDHAHANLYTDVVLAALPQAARDYLEDLMTSTTYRYQSDFARRYFDEGRDQGHDEGLNEGRVKGEVTALFAVLAARGIEISDELRDQIMGCTDHDQLATWVQRAATATKPGDLFA